jgi:hypothetical protein
LNGGLVSGVVFFGMWRSRKNWGGGGGEKGGLTVCSCANRARGEWLAASRENEVGHSGMCPSRALGLTTVPVSGLWLIFFGDAEVYVEVPQLFWFHGSWTFRH